MPACLFNGRIPRFEKLTKVELLRTGQVKRTKTRKSEFIVRNKHKMFSMALCLGLSISAIAALTGCAGNQNASSFGQYIDDKALQRQVRVALENNPGYDFSEVNVDVHSGAVQLTGLVDTSGQKSRASEVAKNVQFVTTVKNDIALMTHERLSAP